jgi:hypothetical protein
MNTTMVIIRQIEIGGDVRYFRRTFQNTKRGEEQMLSHVRFLRKNGIRFSIDRVCNKSSNATIDQVRKITEYLEAVG